MHVEVFAICDAASQSHGKIDASVLVVLETAVGSGPDEERADHGGQGEEVSAVGSEYDRLSAVPHHGLRLVDHCHGVEGGAVDGEDPPEVRHLDAGVVGSCCC